MIAKRDRVERLAFLKIAAVLSLLGGYSHAIEITPPNPVPRDTLVRIKYEPGQGITVLRQDFSPVDFLDCGNGTAAFTGPPGRYAVFASSEGKLSVTVVQIGDVPNPNPPGPDPVPPGPEPEPLSPAAESVRNLVRQLSAEDRLLAVPQANVYEATAAQVAAGVDQAAAYTGAQAALRALFVNLDQGKRWNPVNARINEILREQKRRDPSAGNIAQTLREIAKGLKAGAA